MTARTPRWLQSILEEHFEELEMLWELRCAAVRDPDYLLEDLCELNERIAAHVDGLVLGRDHAVPLLADALAGGERAGVFAAALPLLKMEEAGLSEQVVHAFASAEGEAVDGFADAFSHANLEPVATALHDLLDHTSSAVASAAAIALAFHQQLDPQHPQIAHWILDAEPAQRRRGWQIVSLIGG